MHFKKTNITLSCFSTDYSKFGISVAHEDVCIVMLFVLKCISLYVTVINRVWLWWCEDTCNLYSSGAKQKQKTPSLFRPLVSYFEGGCKREILGLHLRMQSVCKQGMLIIGDAEIVSESLQLKTLPQACSKHWLVAYPFMPLLWWVMLQPFKTDRDESMYRWCRKGKGPGTAYDVTNCSSNVRDMCASLFWFTRKFSHGVCMCSYLNFKAWSSTLLMFLSC